MTESLPADARSILSAFEVIEAPAGDDVLERVQALICFPPRVKGEMFRKMRGLKMVQTLSAGADGLDFASIPRGAQVFSNAGAFTDSVGEHAWGLLLGTAKGMHLRNQRAAPRTLRDKTLLVVGCGAIGSEVARLSKSLGMKTVGVSRSFKSPELFEERHPLSSLPEVIGSADATVVTLPLTNRTRGTFGYELLSKSKDAAIVVNIGRGETFDEDGTLRWLRERPESRFATDVFWKKGEKEDFSTPGWELMNFAGTLHNSGLPLGEDLTKAKVAAARNVKLFFETGDAMNLVDVSEYL